MSVVAKLLFVVLGVLLVTLPDITDGQTSDENLMDMFTDDPVSMSWFRLTTINLIVIKSATEETITNKACNKEEIDKYFPNSMDHSKLPTNAEEMGPPCRILKVIATLNQSV